MMAPSDPTPASTLIARLAEREQRLAVAESCTGGGLGASLTAVPGSSLVFVGGVIAYSDDVKRSLLGVSGEVLARHGAVSGPVAEAMAEGARQVFGVDWGIGITGVAGPGGGSPEKPVGTVWIAVAGARSVAESHHFDGDRYAVRKQATEQALTMLSAALDVDVTGERR